MKPLGPEEIEGIIPHRWPFLLVDRIIEIEDGKRAVGIKNVSYGELFFQGHFPGRPIMPGVLIVEALAQVGAVAMLGLPENQGKIALFAGIDNFHFRKPVVPGDTLRLEVTMTRTRGPIGKGLCRAEVDGQVVAEGGLTFALVSADSLR